MKIALLTDPRFINPKPGDAYVENIFLEDKILAVALEAEGFSSTRLSWDDKMANWIDFDLAIFRTTWDYFDRFEEFSAWLSETESKVRFLNEPNLIRWNWDKFYLRDLENMGIPIPETLFIPKNSGISLQVWAEKTNWNSFILKPAIGGGGRHTYKFGKEMPPELSNLFMELNKKEAFLIQAFQESILEKGEVSLMVMDGQFTHAIRKKAKPGDFRVQDDFGGTVHPYEANEEEKQFAEKVFSTLKTKALYGRVDVIWNAHNQACVSELELIEPELWFRNYPPAASILAKGISKWVKEN